MNYNSLDRSLITPEYLAARTKAALEQMERDSAVFAGKLINPLLSKFDSLAEVGRYKTTFWAREIESLRSGYDGMANPLDTLKHLQILLNKRGFKTEVVVEGTGAVVEGLKVSWQP